MKDMKNNGKKCLGENCQRDADRRGLCSACYQVWYKLIQTKKVTWEKLEAAGKAAPSLRGQKEKLFLESLRKK